MLPVLVALAAAEYDQMRQYIDHYNTHSNAFFNQTIYIGQKYSNATSSILLFLGGRRSITKYDVESKILSSLAKETGSLIVGLEHRCFGTSQPNNIQTCTIEQALGDIDELMKYVNTKYCVGRCRVVLVGSSYSGALATWFRVRYPQRSAGVWASSAPLKMKTEFPEFDEFVAGKLDFISEGCLARTKAVMDKLHETVRSGNSKDIAKLKEMFGFNETQDDVSFLYVVAQVLSSAVENSDAKWDFVRDHCTAIATNQSVDTLANSFKTIIDDMDETPESLDPLLFPETSDKRSALFMSCNQLGQFPTASGKLRSPFINITYFNRVCHKHFGVNAANASLTDFRFGGTDPRVSSAVFTNGENDPYAQLSVTSSETVMGRTSLFVFEGGRSTDLFYEGEEWESLGVVRDICTRKMRQWALNECEKYCHMGQCVLQKCVCIDMWDGEFCDQQTHTLTAFRSVTTICITLPTAILIIISVAVWACGKHDETVQLHRATTFT